MPPLVQSPCGTTVVLRSGSRVPTVKFWISWYALAEPVEAARTRAGEIDRELAAAYERWTLLSG